MSEQYNEEEIKEQLAVLNSTTATLDLHNKTFIHVLQILKDQYIRIEKLENDINYLSEEVRRINRILAENRIFPKDVLEW